MGSLSPKLLVLFVPLLLAAPAAGWQSLAGTPEIEQQLERLNVLGSVLMIAAHPDDENTAVLAYFARGRHLRTGYLSCTRGEGGQNLIGPEQGDLLGLIRTQELLEARKIDGAEQFFTRAIDFGFSKSAEETLEKWGREKTLSDMVWVIRRFRPDVVILRFSGTPRDGHGQHQASAILGKEAYFAAADPKRFPEQLASVQPWHAKRLLFNVFSFTADQERAAAASPNKTEIDTGEFNPVLGESYNEIAGRSRSMHRSQSMGAPRRKGPSLNYLVPIAGDPPKADSFDGIDTTWHRVSGGDAVGTLLTRAIHEFRPDHPDQIIPLLLQAHKLIAAIDDPLARAKLSEVDEAIGSCSGLWLDAVTDRDTATPGSNIHIRLTALNRSRFPLTLEGIRVEGMGETANLELAPKVLGYNQPSPSKLDRKVPDDQPESQPFWLQQPPQGDTYTITNQNWIGLADTPPLLEARFEVAAGSEHIVLRRPVLFRYVDHVLGELTRPFIVAPKVEIHPAQKVVLFPAGESRRIQIAVRSSTSDASGELRLKLGKGWKAEPASAPFRLTHAGEQQDLSFTVTPPSSPSNATLEATATVDGREIATGTRVISYPHIPVQTVFPAASLRLVRSNIRVTARRVGYVMGAGDQMPDSLRQLGCEVTLLSPSDLEQRNLLEFDAIVAGVRAYNVRPDIRANQPRLLEYVKQGGTFIVQYNTGDGSLPELGPYPFSVGRSRVAVEDAPVSFPNPENPLLKTPNAITPQDFEGWVQERGLYFATDWDPRYQTVMTCHDPQEPPLPGGTLYTRYGKGVYIFTAYSWFRELPAGVPGAYRLFANMLSAK